MKKIVYTVAVACMLVAAVSCKSTKAAKNAAAGTDAVESAAENTGAPNAKKSAKEKRAEKKAAKKQQKEQKKQQKDQKDNNDKNDYTGWIKSSKGKINERFGNVQIKVKPGIGSFTLAAANDRNKPVSVLATSNEYVTNAVFLKTSKKVYNLVTDSNVRSSARRTADGVVIEYEVPSVAQVSLYFSFLASQKKKETDMVRITATVKNISARNEDFAIKVLLDTVLGESAAYHFYTYEDVPIKNEVLYRTMQNQKWFVSKNLTASMQIFFAGADCTVPEIVAFGNYSTLEKNNWEPDMLNYRVFDTVLSYNNSAVCAIWKPFKLGANESGKNVFYIAVSADGSPATGEKYIYSKDFNSASEEEGEKKNAVTPLEVITPYSSEGANEEKPFVEEIKEPEPVKEVSDLNPSQEAKNDEIPNVDFYIQNMSKEQLSPEYIQNLLDRIAALEEDSSSLNRQELLQLNAELDAILTYLRQ